MVMARRTILLLSLTALAQGLVYPLENEFLSNNDMLIPALPRPMTTVADAPFHFIASWTPAVVVKINVSPQDTQNAIDMADKLYLVVFTANTEMELPFVFLYGYRVRSSGDIMIDMCSHLDLKNFKEASSGITSFTSTKFKIVKGRKTNLLMANTTIEHSGYQYAFVLNCNENDVSLVTGSLIFRNPHGFLPGGWYLKLPFSLLVMILYLVSLIIFAVKCILYYDQVMFVQYGVILVLVMGFIEQLSNYLTFLFINGTGELPCCPVRTDMGLCMVVSAAKRAFFVTFLLFVSLGYGIQRPNLRRWEYTAVAVTGIVYLLAAVNYELAVISEIDSTGGENDPASAQPSTVVSSLILSVLNIVVVYWVYMSLVAVIEDLENKKQEAKKNMYESLVRSIIIWFVVGFLAEGLFYGWLTNKITTPWKYDMVPKFIWDVLFFLVVVQVGWLWVPNNTTKQFAYAQQLPTDDFDDFDGGDETEDEIEFANNPRSDDDINLAIEDESYDEGSEF